MRQGCGIACPLSSDKIVQPSRTARDFDQDATNGHLRLYELIEGEFLNRGCLFEAVTTER